MGRGLKALVDWTLKKKKMRLQYRAKIHISGFEYSQMFGCGQRHTPSLVTPVVEAEQGFQLGFVSRYRVSHQICHALLPRQTIYIYSYKKKKFKKSTNSEKKLEYRNDKNYEYDWNSSSLLKCCWQEKVLLINQDSTVN